MTETCPVCAGRLAHRRTVGDHEEYRCTRCGRDWTTDRTAGDAVRTGAAHLNHWPELPGRVVPKGIGPPKDS